MNFSTVKNASPSAARFTRASRLGRLAAMLAAVYAAWPGGADGKTPPNNLVVYGPVPGLAPSEHYAVRVRSAKKVGRWQNTSVFQTACKDFGRFIPRISRRSTPKAMLTISAAGVILM